MLWENLISFGYLIHYSVPNCQGRTTSLTKAFKGAGYLSFTKGRIMCRLHYGDLHVYEAELRPYTKFHKKTKSIKGTPLKD